MTDSHSLPDLSSLISLVQENEILWNKTMADHNNNKWKNAAWKKIGQEWYGSASIVESARLAQTEWYRLWRKYKSEYKKMKKHMRVMPHASFNSSFEHFDQLGFLNPIMDLVILNDAGGSTTEAGLDHDGVVQYPDPMESINDVANQAIHDFLKEETPTPVFLKEEVTEGEMSRGMMLEEDEMASGPSGSGCVQITSVPRKMGLENSFSRKRKHSSADLLSGVENMLQTCANTLVDRIYDHCATSLDTIAQKHEEKVKSAVMRKSIDPDFLKTVGNLLEKVPQEKREHVKYEVLRVLSSYL